MIYINAFLVGGAVCLLWRALDSLFRGKVSVPRLLALGMLAGALLAAAGLMEKLTLFAQAGIMVMTPVAGDAVYSIAYAIMNGAPLSAALPFALLIAGLYTLPYLFGVLRYLLHKDSD